MLHHALDEHNNSSKTANVAAAERAMIVISSTSSFFFGIAKAAKATVRPSTRYFTARFKEKIMSLVFTETNKVQEAVYQYDRLVQEDVSKRKRVKNSIPGNNRCHAKRANCDQCTRKQKDGFVYCGTRIKGVPHGVMNSSSEEDGQICERSEHI